MLKENKELKLIFTILLLLFSIFLFYPLILIFIKAFQSGSGFTFSHFTEFVHTPQFAQSIINSFKISGLSALVSVSLAFFLAYAIHFTNISNWLKRIIGIVATLPMLIPTITYGFAIIYSFGNQGLITKIFGFQPFDLYGFNGLLIGYVIYTLPIAFTLIKNTMRYMDKKQLIVSRLMGDNGFTRFTHIIFVPLIGTLAIAFIQTFFMSFTDFGIPAAIGGQYDVIASTLYNQMLGSIPNFSNGAVTAIVMLLPSIIAIFVIKYLERFNVKYDKISNVELPTNKIKDVIFTVISFVFIIAILSIFAVVFILPFIKEWPYMIEFTFDHILETFQSSNLIQVLQNSFVISIITAVLGTTICYVAAVITARGKMPKLMMRFIDFVSTLSNALPGMVIGIGFLFAFSGTSIQNTFIIIILSNIIHFFSTPYMMIKNAFLKMNDSWETTANLLGDSWFQTLRRIMIPNSLSTIFEMISYYFINGMVTISAIIFLVGSRTTVVTTKIKELQHFAKFSDIFVLSIIIFLSNLIMKWLMSYLNQKVGKKYE